MENQKTPDKNLSEIEKEKIICPACEHTFFYLCTVCNTCHNCGYEFTISYEKE